MTRSKATVERKRILRIPISPQVVAVVAVISLLSACGASSSSQSQASDGNVTFGSVGGLTDAGVYIAEARGYFKQEHIAVKSERMEGGSALTTALATGNLDVAGISVSAGLFNAVSRGIGLRIVGDKQSIRPGVSATHLVAQKKLAGKTTAESIHNLRGKVVAVSDKTSGTTAVLDFLLKKYGMSVDDLNLKVLGYSEITAGLINGSVDAAIELEPFLTQVLASGHIADLSDQSAVVPSGGATIVPLVYSQSFIDDNRDVAQRFMIAYMKGVRDYNDAMLHGKDKSQIVAIIAKGAGVDEKTVTAAHVAGLDPDQTVNVNYLGQLEKWFEDQGYVHTYVKPSDMVDDSFAKHAVSELGPYKPASK